MSPRIVVLVLLALALIARPDVATAQADEKPVWSSFSDAEYVTLSFAIPNSDGIMFSLLCNNKRRSTELTIFEELKGQRVGRPITIELTAGTAKAAVKGVTATDEMMGFVYGKAARVAPAPILAVLREPGELTVRIGSMTATYPEQDRAAAIKGFTDGCKVK